MEELTPRHPTKVPGLVAIIDALGVRALTDDEIVRFLKVRNSVAQSLKSLISEAATRGARPPKNLHTFLLNDTIVIVLESDGIATFADVAAMCWLLTGLFVPAFLGGVLFRGAVAIGDFYVDPDMNTVLGPAVVDAADWHDKAEWVGVHFTPSSSLMIQRFMFDTTSFREWAVLKYSVPLKQGKAPDQFVLNWLGECVGHLLSEHPSPGPRSQRRPMTRKHFLELLARGRISHETHAKYANTLAYIDWYLQNNPDHT